MIIFLCDDNSIIIITDELSISQIQIHRYGKIISLNTDNTKKNNSCELLSKKFMEELDETRDIGSGEEG